jgi:hypothetical protein
MWDSAYVCGIEGIPWPGTVQWAGDTLVIHRPVEESGKVYLPYNVPGCGLLTLGTCSLRQNGCDYLLPLELARGSNHRVRNQADQWQRSGMRIPDSYQTALREGNDRFLDAVLLQKDPTQSTQAAHESLRNLETAGDLLVTAYSDQALVYRKHQDRQVGSLLGASLDANPAPVGDAEQLYRSAFNSVQLRMHWASVEKEVGQFDFEPFDKLLSWASQMGLRVCGGPLIDFQPKLLPHWLYVYEDDFPALVDAVTRFTTLAVERYRSQVHVWNCVAGLNSPGPMRLTDEQVMRITVAVLQAVRRADPRTPVLVSVDQPWGEYLANSKDGLSPLHFADILVRSDLGLSGIGLQLRPGYWPGGCLPRSLLDINALLDRCWGMLGLPLLIQLATPAGTGLDTQSSLVSAPIAGTQNMLEAGDSWTRRLLRLLLAKQFVQGIFWDSWDDRLPHQLPNAGLINSSGAKRPLADILIEHRKAFLT